MIAETLRFDSGGLSLEGRLSYADDCRAPAAAVLICPPHPFLGGDMDNNVITALAATLPAAGMPTLCFNYRGIGASECARDLAGDLEQFWAASTCPEYEAEILVDATNAFAELERLLPPPLPLGVLGYSFGTLPAIAIARSRRVEHLALISPPLAKWSLSPPARELACGVFHAPGDFACPESRLLQLFETLPQPKLLRSFDDTDHFFVGREADLAAAVRGFMVGE